MSINIEVSIGELFDKVSILEIKKENGIEEAEKELNILNEKIEDLTVPIYVQGIARALKAINSMCWEVEDKKRECERQKDFKEDFIQTSRAVYILNDERARLKGLINKYMQSDIVEYKNHRSY
jgi:hypothetical protein|tara:strand:+ start:159 stop:527 length:369 start_codon:yes stop_codon:yes gene_type:complete